MKDYNDQKVGSIPITKSDYRNRTRYKKITMLGKKPVESKDLEKMHARGCLGSIRLMCATRACCILFVCMHDFN